MKRLIRSLVFVVSAIVSFAGCEKVDNHRIPSAGVKILFNTIGDWQLFGVSGAGQTREFIRQDGLPVGFNYSVSESTGFGGVMLVCDPNGEYLAYDLACPVERNSEIRVSPDNQSTTAGIVKCHKCGSTYDIYAQGTPRSGEALKMKYGLEPYRVFVGNQTPPYAYIVR